MCLTTFVRGICSAHIVNPRLMILAGLISRIRKQVPCKSGHLPGTLINGTKINPSLILVNDTRGSCHVNGEVYLSDTSIPRAHPCHYCLCIRNRVQCYWKECSPPPTGCLTMAYDTICDPSLYMCRK